MAWVTDLKNFRRSNFFQLRLHLLLSYLTVMAAILGVFAVGAYIFLTRSFYRQLDEKLQILAQAAAPSLEEVEIQGSEYLDLVDEVPWRDIFNRRLQSLEWFDSNGERIARKGQLDLMFPPRPGPQTQGSFRSTSVRSFTISVYTDSRENGQPDLVGYIRASQSGEDLQTLKTQLLWGLGMGGLMALGSIGVGGMWLTQKALAPTEQSFKQLQQFTADASHELRGPLTAIKTSIDVIRSHPERIHPKDTRKLAAISSASEQMKHLVEDLLFLARTDTQVPIAPREWGTLALNPLLRNILELLGPSAQAKEITLTSELPFVLFVSGDKAQLTRLFSNLVDNALKYTPKGGKVQLSLEKQGRFAVATVKDTGIGISERHLPHVFDRFWRADKARSRRERGTGLGLAIAQAIAIRHGGKITVTSQIGEGSCFQVRLPRVVSTVTMP
ncbi:MAG: HAMP domain-containing sensor histidine kinase [Cyanobacteriota bacterium]|nr:HAMP domain-containing sensor histidine kinase [Cyanobacteriota bacterium]